MLLADAGAVRAVSALRRDDPRARRLPAWRPDAPFASHAMLYLDAPFSFKRSMFQQSAELGARSIRVDLALTAVFTADGSETGAGSTR